MIKNLYIASIFFLLSNVLGAMEISIIDENKALFDSVIEPPTIEEICDALTYCNPKTPESYYFKGINGYWHIEKYQKSMKPFVSIVHLEKREIRTLHCQKYHYVLLPEMKHKNHVMHFGVLYISRVPFPEDV